MKIEEAIKELKEELKEVITWLAIYKHNEEICEPKERRKRAIETAIMALEQQLCEDCISRAKALEMLGDEPENWTDTEKEIQEVNDYRWFKSILEELPSVTPTISDVENNYNIGYNCGYTDAMIDIAEGE